MSRSRRPDKRSKCGPSGTCEVCNPDMRVKRATVETPEELVADESFAQIGREVEALADADEWLRGYRAERAMQREGGLPNYAAANAFFGIFGMVRVEE